ncbi:RNA polymerase sigma factor [Flagellimonas marinaquae]|uniref:RNA polymerase sigma factor n=1 Tax=Flagellimonas marinaquae TaxID=254955 RepID=UPI002074D6C7|nr:RNA polymerase sigma factor [Allomuricauda aquimarina]USD26820.1 RNA polymerase sigma factor [Allomuricauda aquimarina]
MAAKNDNHNNLTTFFNEEYGSLRSYVKSRIRDTSEQDAEDIVQDVALRIFSRPEDAIPITNVGGFVYNAIRNRIIDIMRGKKEKKLPSEEIDRQWREFAEFFYGDADNSYSTEMEQALKKAVEDLKPVYRDIVIAIDFEGYNYRQIAERTGIPAGTLMSRRHRAMSELSKKLEKIKEPEYGN